MLLILTNRQDILNAQQQFVARLAGICNRQIQAKVGYQGGYADCTILWSQGLGLWFYSDYASALGKGKTRYWNAFGLSQSPPRQSSMLSIVCEINPPIDGLNKYVQGAFARDDNGHVWLLHRGRIGGGKPGIGRKLFFDNYQGEDEEIGGDRFAVIGDIAQPDFVEQVTHFVREVNRIKGAG